MEAQRRLDRRRQGDLGEASAIEWFTRLGGTVFAPLGHSAHSDLVVELDGHLLRIQVKTSTQLSTVANGPSRITVTLATNGGNQSWSGLSKSLDFGRLDFLFVLTGDGRRWLIPAAALEACRAITLGGEKYSEYEIDSGGAIRHLVFGDPCLDSAARPGEYPSGQRMATVNRPATPSQVRILPPPLTESGVKFSESKHDRKLGKSGQTRINAKRKVTVPRAAVIEAGLEVGDRLKARCDGFGRIILQRIELPRSPLAPSESDHSERSAAR